MPSRNRAVKAPRKPLAARRPRLVARLTVAEIKPRQRGRFVRDEAFEPERDSFLRSCSPKRRRWLSVQSQIFTARQSLASTGEASTVKGNVIPLRGGRQFAVPGADRAAAATPGAWRAHSSRRSGQNVVASVDTSPVVRLTLQRPRGKLSAGPSGSQEELCRP